MVKATAEEASKAEANATWKKAINKKKLCICFSKSILINDKTAAAAAGTQVGRHKTKPLPLLWRKDDKQDDKQAFELCTC